MTYTLSFLPEIEEDALAGYLWYEAKSSGLGEDFLRIFYACVSEISRNSLLYPRTYNAFRRRLLRRFPYAIYYMVEDNKIIMAGLFHCARDPHSIQLALQERERDSP
jgi:hypothetical protein